MPWPPRCRLKQQPRRRRPTRVENLRRGRMRPALRRLRLMRPLHPARALRRLPRPAPALGRRRRPTVANLRQLLVARPRATCKSCRTPSTKWRSGACRVTPDTRRPSTCSKPCLPATPKREQTRPSRARRCCSSGRRSWPIAFWPETSLYHRKSPWPCRDGSRNLDRALQEASGQVKGRRVSLRHQARPDSKDNNRHNQRRAPK